MMLAGAKGHGITMQETTPIERRRQFCSRCNGLMFEYYHSPDGHFGLVGDIYGESIAGKTSVRCPTCGARYRLLEMLDATGWPVAREL